MGEKIKEIRKLTDEKWLNLYKIFYQNGKEYVLASRNDWENLELTKSNPGCDGVRILPYFVKGEKTYVVFIKEFRSPLNRYIYELPAGLVEAGESPEQAAERELEEEIGGEILSLKKISNKIYSSAGMTDESLVLFQAEVSLSGKQKLEETEDISIELVEVSNIPDFLSQHEFCMSSHLMALAFYYEKLSKTQK